MGKYIQKVTGLILTSILLTISSVIAQAPLGFNYQGVALTNAGTPVSNKVISLRIALIESQQLGTTRFQETHNVNTDAYGQFSVIIGNGQASTGKISDVQWSKFPYYMKVELDLNGGTAYVFVGTSQLLSVPYALYANNAGAASISVDSIKNELATIRLVQKGDSIVLNNNRGGVFIPKIDSLIKVTSQLASIKAGVLKNIKDSITKLPNGIAIGYNALNNFDSIAFNSSNIALGQNAGIALTKKTSGISNADNILIGQNAAASINASSINTGAYQNIMIGNGAGQNTNLLASQNIVIGHEAARNSSGTLGTKTSVFNNNIAIGARTLRSAIASESNVSIGVDNMNSSIAASRNVTIGYAAAKGVTGDDNVIIGNETVTDTSSNSAQNVIIGSNAAQKFMGNQSVIIGFQAGQNAYLKNPAATGGVVAIGSQAGLNNLIGLGTFVGQNAGRENTTGFDNTFIGARSGWSNTTGAYNTYLGFSAGHFGRSGSHNTFIGRSAGYGNIRGDYNTLIGAFSADIPTDTIKTQSNNVVLGSWAARKMNGSSNVILGDHSAQYAKVGNQNIIIGGVMQNETDSIGDNKLYIGNSNTKTPLIYGEFDNKKVTINGDLTVTGKLNGSNNTLTDNFSNVFVGQNAGSNYQDVFKYGYGSNTAIGVNTLRNNTDYWNVAVGGNALSNGINSRQNTAIGYNSMVNYKKGFDNVAVGYATLSSLDSGIYNTALGTQTLLNLKAGNDNTGLGYRALADLKSGSYNVAIGWGAGNALDTGSSNIFIGRYSGSDQIFKKINNKLIIHNSPTANPLIYGDFSLKQLNINGTLSTAGTIQAFSAKTSAYTILTSDEIITVDATSGIFTITLPTAVGVTGQTYTIKRINSGSNNVTVGTTSSQTIDGSTTYVLSTQYKYLKVVSDGANWIIVGNN